MIKLGDIPVSMAEVEIPEQRLWTARVWLSEDRAPADGERVILMLGELEMVGTVLKAGVFGGQGQAKLVGGAGGWRTSPPSALASTLAYQNDAGLFANELASSLAGSVGETVEGSPVNVGTHWSFDPLESAAANLDELSSWWMRADGVTVLGQRPSGGQVVATVERLEIEHQMAVCAVDEADLPKFLPGVTITSPSLPAPILARHIRMLIQPNRIRVEVSGHPEAAARIADHAARKRRYLGTYRCRSIQEIASRLELQADGNPLALPENHLVEKFHGLPGLESVLAPSNEALVVFEAGNRSRPMALAYRGIAQSLQFRSIGSVTFSGPVDIPPPVPVALGPALEALKAAVAAFASQIASATNIADIKAAGASLGSAVGAIVQASSLKVQVQ